MTSLIVWLLLTSALVPQESKAVPKDSVEIEARGCLKGRVFTAVPPPGDERTRRGPDLTGRHFRVTGPREVNDLVKAHNGHLVDVVGIVRKAALDDQGAGMRLGRGTRVVIGAPGTDPTRMDARTSVPSMPVMDVTVLRLVSDRCPIN
jgi:hypothetical protein